MKKQMILLIVLLNLLMPVATADVVNELELKINDYNENTEHVPSFLKTLLGNEVIKLAITTDSGHETYLKVVTENAYVVSFEEIDPTTRIEETISIRTDEATVQSILDSGDPLGTFLEAKDSGKIVIKPVGFTKSMAFTLASAVLKLSQMFGFI
ncbi:MAG: hypothetical protein QCH31_05620 [Methanolobus sp.]|nr:hypothetical protein [Methanolobus sp.]